MIDILIIRSYVILLQGKPDTCTLVSNYQGPFKPEVDNGPLQLRFQTPPGEGIGYLRNTFPGLTIEVTDARVSPARVYLAENDL